MCSISFFLNSFGIKVQFNQRQLGLNEVVGAYRPSDRLVFKR